MARTSDGAAATMRPDTLCDSCIRECQRCLDELPHYLTALAAFKSRSQQASGQSKVQSSSEPAAPCNVAVIDLVDEIVFVMMDIYDCPIRDYVTQPGGVERALQLRKLHSQAEGIVGLSRVWERRRAPCRECGLPTLGNWSGEETILCTNSECAVMLTKTEYEQWCELKAKDK